MNSGVNQFPRAGTPEVLSILPPRGSVTENSVPPSALMAYRDLSSQEVCAELRLSGD